MKTSALDTPVTGDRTHVGLFIPLPLGLAERFPDLSPDDPSPPHVTFLIVGEVPAFREQEFLTIVGEVLSEVHAPVKAWLHQLDFFVHPEPDRQVAFMSVGFDRQMAIFRDRCADLLKEAGFDVKDRSPLVYTPHVTLGYVDDAWREKKWDGPEIYGAWYFDTIEVWGLPKLHGIELGVAPPPYLHASVDRVASAYLSGKRER